MAFQCLDQKAKTQFIEKLCSVSLPRKKILNKAAYQSLEISQNLALHVLAF